LSPEDEEWMLSLDMEAKEKKAWNYI